MRESHSKNCSSRYSENHETLNVRIGGIQMHTYHLTASNDPSADRNYPFRYVVAVDVDFHFKAN